MNSNKLNNNEEVISLNKTKMTIDFNRLKNTIEQSASIGTIPKDGLRRLALTKEDQTMRDLFKKWLEEAGLEVRIDDFGNMFGRRNGKTDLPPVVMGSHLDTQPNGGRFDGILGVLTPLEIIQTLNEHDIETDRPIEIVNFTNEEGARFEPPLLGSGGSVGVFTKDYVYSRTDRNGKTFEEELNNIGYKGDAKHRLKQAHAFIELHIEQGPVLESKQVAIGAVAGIKGMTWLELTVSGKGGHAGPTPMSLRHDALFATSDMISRIEKESKIDSDISVTVGRLSVKPDVTNCIPEEVIFSLDVRHTDDDVRLAYINHIKSVMLEIADQRGVNLNIEELWEVQTTNFHSDIVTTIETQAKALGYTVERLYSGAGHDAKYVHEIAPTGMIFVPSIGGISHVEEEYSTDEDIEKGANVLLHTILQLANQE